MRSTHDGIAEQSWPIAFASLASADASPGSIDADCIALATALGQIMRELRGVVAGLTPGQYTARAGDAFAGASIGGHVRHCLDHARALADGCRDGLVDYDHRARGTIIESDPVAADAELGHLLGSIERMAKMEALLGLRVVVMPSRDGASVVLGSTLARELAFILSHTIHHNATIRGIAISLGCDVPASFGCAPSTLAHRDGVGDRLGSERCAR